MSSMITSSGYVTARPSAAPLLDVALAFAAFAGTLIAIVHGGGVPEAAAPLDLTRVVLAACATAPLILWRRFPLVVFAITASASVLLAWHGSAGGFTPGPAAALFLLAASRTRQTPWRTHTSIIVITLFAAYVAAAAVARQAFPGIETLHASLAWAVAWFAGERTRLRHEQITELHERAQRAEQDAVRDRQLAIAQERARIARDLHDSAAHAISLIAVRAGAARLRHHQDPARSLQTLQAIEELARHTVEEIDQIVGTLRDGSPVSGQVEAPPGLASLDTLISNHMAAGLHVSLTATGQASMLTGAADQAVYRILQEALTNAARYGTGQAEIALTFGPTSAELKVANRLRAGTIPESGGGGHGLIGMRERATLLGGTLHAESVNGTFEVHAVIPYGGQRL